MIRNTGNNEVAFGFQSLKGACSDDLARYIFSRNFFHTQIS
jgi:hypothetical protein